MNTKTKPKKTVKTSMSDFFTKENSESGVKLDLLLPSGIESGHFLIVRGIDSFSFRVATNQALRAAKDQVNHTKGEISIEDQLNIVESKELNRTASLIAGWSFDEECNTENVISFLENAPHVRQQVEAFSANRSNFLVQPSSS